MANYANPRSDCVPSVSNCVDRVLFGTFETAEGCGPVIKDGCVSGTFEVNDRPVIIRGFDIPDGQKIVLEAVAGPNGGTYFEPVRLNCGGLVGINSCVNTLVIPIPGRYRLNRCYCSSDTLEPAGLPHVEWQEVCTGVNLNLGDMSTMGCCNETTTILNDGPGNCKTLIVGSNSTIICPSSVVTVTSQPTQTILNVDGAVTVIPHGDQVQCVAGGLTINGVFCDTGSTVSFVDNGDCTGTLTIDGTAYTVVTEDKVDPNSHAPAAIANTDGTIAVVAAGQSFTINVNSTAVAAEMAADPSAVSILCSALAGCIAAAIPAPPVVPVATNTVQGRVALAVASEYPSPTNDTDAATPAYVDAAVAAAVIPDATDTIKGKVALAVAANYPQTTNDLDAATPAYVRTETTNLSFMQNIDLPGRVFTNPATPGQAFPGTFVGGSLDAFTITNPNATRSMKFIVTLTGSAAVIVGASGRKGVQQLLRINGAYAGPVAFAPNNIFDFAPGASFQQDMPLPDISTEVSIGPGLSFTISRDWFACAFDAHAVPQDYYLENGKYTIIGHVV